MPDHSPFSRYLLFGIAAVMLTAALPDLEVLLRQARQWRQARPVVERIVYR